jgi:pantetheine-phosphate adenylyltransferase
VLVTELTVLVARNPAKKSTPGAERRVQSIRGQIEANWDNVSVDSWPGLTVDYCREHGITVIVRGVRNRRDFLYETQLAAMNRCLAGIETLLLPASADLALISSSLIRRSDEPVTPERGEHD